MVATRRGETVEEVLAVPWRLLQHMSPFTQNRNLPWEAYAQRPKKFDGLLMGLDDASNDADDDDFYGDGWEAGWSSTRALHDMAVASSALPPLERAHPPPGEPPPRSLASPGGMRMGGMEYDRPVSRGDTGSRGMSPRSGFSDAAPMLPLID